MSAFAISLRSTREVAFGWTRLPPPSLTKGLLRRAGSLRAIEFFIGAMRVLSGVRLPRSHPGVLRALRLPTSRPVSMTNAILTSEIANHPLSLYHRSDSRPDRYSAPIGGAPSSHARTPEQPLMHRCWAWFDSTAIRCEVALPPLRVLFHRARFTKPSPYCLSPVAQE